MAPTCIVLAVDHAHSPVEARRAPVGRPRPATEGWTPSSSSPSSCRPRAEPDTRPPLHALVAVSTERAHAALAGQQRHGRSRSLGTGGRPMYRARCCHQHAALAARITRSAPPSCALLTGERRCSRRTDLGSFFHRLSFIVPVLLRPPQSSS
jgi:hypothetical protein